ncbi:MAG: isocitrate lyase/phosphoenolpyruvate mutase family protein [Balneolaceae bacterium]|nr:isocitrate lyase/phosphoenolpyruvate mutase family protein [Balneolaceae bacterium]
MSTYQEFVKLHQEGAPLIIGNVWDVPSARMFEKHGFKALGTSSAAIAQMLGYEDGEEMTFPELKYIVERLIDNISVPLSVDIEGGYSREPSEIIHHITQLAKLGVAGINIEDSIVVNRDRGLSDTGDFADIISTIKEDLAENSIDMFLNIRTDPFLVGVNQPLEETLGRISTFKDSGADGIFIPCIIDEGDIQAVVAATSLPVNVMCMPGLPDFKTLRKLGVRRISMGNFIHGSIAPYLEQTIARVEDDQSFERLF